MVIETLYVGGFKTCFVYVQLILLTVNVGEGGKEQKSILPLILPYILYIPTYTGRPT
jgi:hypothetical protein